MNYEEGEVQQQTGWLAFNNYTYYNTSSKHLSIENYDGCNYLYGESRDGLIKYLEESTYSTKVFYLVMVESGVLSSFDVPMTRRIRVSFPKNIPAMTEPEEVFITNHRSYTNAGLWAVFHYYSSKSLPSRFRTARKSVVIGENPEYLIRSMVRSLLSDRRNHNTTYVSHNIWIGWAQILEDRDEVVITNPQACHSRPDCMSIIDDALIEMPPYVDLTCDQ